MERLKDLQQAKLSEMLVNQTKVDNNMNALNNYKMQKIYKIIETFMLNIQAMCYLPLYIILDKKITTFKKSLT